MNLIIMAIMAVSLTPRQQALSAIAACEAKGDQMALSACLNEGFDNGLTVSEAKEALSQLYAYTGFPRSLNALGTLQTVLKDREAKGLRTEPGKEADPLPADYDALRQGTEVQTALSGQAFHYTFPLQIRKRSLFYVGERLSLCVRGHIGTSPEVAFGRTVR